MQVLLPKGNAEHPTQQYPVFYTVGRCSERAPFGFDDSYVLNLPNNGPSGDAITQELIAEIDARFRTVAAPYAPLLTGGSTGG